MKKITENIIMITAGGIGQRFGAETPKQFQMINGKPVIEYVIDACKASKLVDEIVVVSDPTYHDFISKEYNVHVAENGTTLNHSKRNGLTYIKSNFECKKIIIADAVRPTITSQVFDKFFKLIDNYDAVACAKKITDSLGRRGEWIVNREEYYTLYAPEAFNYKLLEKHFRADSPYTESIQQLPENSKVFLDFDVPYFDKLTYPEDIFKLSMILSKAF